ncbi:MAG TPA: DUF72 domain-containing protein [Allosphingosinicella sp.]|nr:DUF72 domain-containing protein [Allosphingosinicella sp.]
MSAKGTIRIGVGGWDYDPWRASFYPDGLPKKKQLEHAATRLTAVEINATFYKLQKAELFERWAQCVPDDFRFAVKASRYCTNRKKLGEAAEGIGRFCAQGFTALGAKLGPILWQLAPTKRFEAEELSAFLMLLPTSRDGIRLRHAIEVRHESFRCREFVAMARAADVAIVIAEHDEYPQIADLTSDFVYVRLQRTREDEPTGYPAAELDRWASVARGWAKGESPAGLSYLSETRAPVQPRDVFLFVISGAKVRNPLAAEALIGRLQ